MKKNYLLLIIALSLSLQNFSQHSFQTIADSANYWIGDVAVNEQNEVLAIGYQPFSDFVFSQYIYFNFISEGTGLKEGYRFDLAPYKVLDKHKTYLSGAKLLAVHEMTGPINSTENLLIYLLDLETEEYWIKTRPYRVSADFCLGNTGNIFMVNSPTYSSGNSPYLTTDIFELFSLSDKGDILWKKGFQLSKTNFSSFKINTNQIECHSDNTIFVNGRFYDYNNSGFSEYFVMSFDALGNSLKWKTTKEHQVDQLYVGTEGEVYLLGSTTTPSSSSGNKRDALLVKMDKNLNLLWAKIFYAEDFEYSRSSLTILDDGTLILGYSTDGAFPVILSKLNTEGDIIWEKGYALYDPQLKGMPDGSLLMLTRLHFDENGQIFFKQIVSKTDPEGNIEGCEDYPTCLQSTETVVEFGDFDFQTISISDFDSIEINFEPFEMSFSDFCDTPPPPNPEFYLPDTICLGDCVQSTETYNHFAHGIEWQLTGNNTDSLLRDSFHFNYCFSEAGTYTLRQTIWFLGCDYSYEHTVTVLEDLEVHILPDEVICEDPPFVLEVESSRELTHYLWSDGSTEPYLEIFEGGVYELQANDGFCEGVDTIEIRFISELISEEVIVLPNDTVICAAHLPYILVPQSPFAEWFQLNSEQNQASIFEINQAGEYLISTMVEGCVFQKTFKLETDECLVPVYLPNIFSPNGDGVNDVFSPMGNEFEAVQLSIYDRWGGQVFEGTGDSVSWDGRREGSELPAGVYVYTFQYLNTLTGERLELSGDVTLVR